jgi:hypothetical protein
MTVTGDVTLNDGTTYTTTLQTTTPTFHRVINLPDATGTVALVAGVSGQIMYNNTGYIDGSANLTFDGTTLTSVRLAVRGAAAASVSPTLLTGTWFSGGTATTTKPYFLIEPTGTTSTGWVTTGTGLGVNAPSGFTGRLVDLQLNGSSKFYVDYTGAITTTGGGTYLGNLTARPSSTQDAVILSGRAGGTSSFGVTLTPTTLTASRTLTLPNSTGTVALVAGSSGQVTYNSSGVSSGSANLTFDGTTLTAVGIAVSGTAAASVSPTLLTGTWFSGGTATTTKPYFLIEPTGTTSTGWVTTGTGLGVNAPSGFTGRLLDFQVDGTSEFYVDYTGSVVALGSLTTRPASTQDAVSLAGRAGGTSSYGVTLTPTTLSADRTLTLPDTSGTVLTSTDIYGWAIAASYGMMMP